MIALELGPINNLSFHQETLSVPKQYRSRAVLLPVTKNNSG